MLILFRHTQTSLKHMQYVNILGVKVSAVNMTLVLQIIDQWIRTRRSNYVCVTPVHSIMECYDSQDLTDIYNDAGLVTPDGMPLVWLSRLQGHPEVSRVYGPDLMLALCEYGLSRSYRHYFYGGAEGVADLLVEQLRTKFPEIKIAGVYSPPFRSLSLEEEQAVAERINATLPDIVWVGLGAPKQERWMSAHLGRLSAPALIGVGAAFDFHAGLKPQAPGWMQRNGLEWVFRLVSEPRRLWKRYLINNPRFIAHTLLQLIGIRTYPIS
jgi:N-acetylglucosaminyldiphosphoundecaprenol N-acetyl-beta-D-mannosaminyltransferase